MTMSETLQLQPFESDDEPARPSIRDAKGELWDAWCVFEGDDFELCDQDDLPEWLEYELGCVGLGDALGASGVDPARCVLEIGVAPGQPFLVRFRQPRYWQDYWGEWDSENMVGEVIGVTAQPIEDTIRAWEAWIVCGQEIALHRDDLPVRPGDSPVWDGTITRIDRGVVFFVEPDGLEELQRAIEEGQRARQEAEAAFVPPAVPEGRFR